MRNYNMQGGVERSCACTPEASYIRSEYVPGMAYVPWQYFTNVYDTDKALEVGTIFPELDKPFLAAGRGCFRK
ncbi:MAG: spore coat associated protein CotJA [Roseburia sp.]